VLIEETEEVKEKQDKAIINQLSKTIAEISKTLDDFGMTPPMMSKILDMVSMNYISKNNKDDEEIRQLRIARQNVKSAIYLPMDNESDYENESLKSEDAQRVF
jgi:hypothetical protein